MVLPKSMSDWMKTVYGLPQSDLVELFQSSQLNISEHIKNIFEERELNETAVVRKFRTTAPDGKNCNIAFYNLDVINSVGYRVKSLRGGQFQAYGPDDEHLTEQEIGNRLFR